MGQMASILFVVVVFAASFISYQNEKHLRDIQATVSELEAGASAMEEHIRGEFGVDGIDAAIEVLVKAESVLLGLVLRAMRPHDQKQESAGGDDGPL